MVYKVSEHAYKVATQKSLEPLLRAAEEQGKWLWSHYQDMWFSPKGLRACHDRGKFLWGAANWKLRDPDERLQQLLRQRGLIEAKIADHERRVKEDPADTFWPV